MKQLQRLGDLRIIMFLVLLLLVLYSVVGSYEEPLPDDPEQLITQAYQTQQPFTVPYTTLLVTPGTSQTLRAAVYGHYKEFTEYHIGLSCVNQNNSPYLVDFTFSHFPQYVQAQKGRVTILDMVLAVPATAQQTTYLCRLELGNPVPAQGYAEARTNLLATKDIYIVVLPPSA